MFESLAACDANQRGANDALMTDESRVIDPWIAQSRRSTRRRQIDEERRSFSTWDFLDIVSMITARRRPSVSARQRLARNVRVRI